ncbi:hypothetical protein shn_29930 (plasmid) [Shinella sp. HZN7]|nr:hypothetical protein shn_29930 [Shinella sp. HZN7]
MGRRGRDFKTVQIICRANGYTEARITDAAAVIVHRLVRPLTTETDDRASEAILAFLRHHDFDRIVRYDIDDEFLHRPVLR